MKSYIIVFILLLYSCVICCDLLEVDIEGNYDYTSIQSAIEEAEDGDEILVYPGTYYENVDFTGKQIEIYSLFATTGERHYIRETIINGNQTGSCIKAISAEAEGTSVIGFTLINGRGTYYNTTPRRCGGGIYVYTSNLSILSCVISENIAEFGGGISVGLDSNVLLSDTSINNNIAYDSGGGLNFVNGSSGLVFDEEERCSIYNNYSAHGADIFSQFDGGTQTIYLDTLTVTDFDAYYVSQLVDFVPWYSMIGLSIEYENVWMEQADSDLYVTPEGDDTNNGLSWDDPLESLTWAMQKIAINPDNPHTIHLDEGTYSATNTGEIMPIQVKDCIFIEGVNQENTIIDGENQSSFLFLNWGNNVFGLKNIKFINSNGETSSIHRKAIQTYGSFRVTYIIENVSFNNNDPYSVILDLKTDKELYINNITFQDNGIYHNPYSFGFKVQNDDEVKTSYLNNIRVVDNNSGNSSIKGEIPNPPIYFISNFVSNGNSIIHGATGFDNCYSLLGIGTCQKCYLINSTLANNTAEIPSTSAAIQVGYYSNLEVINSIIYNNGTEYSINSINDFAGYEVNVHHSLIENGDDGINSVLPFIYDYETNLDCDPMFTGDEDQPLALHEYSPCIDAGTTQMPEGFILPETDAAGNPRIMGNGIDMGAYEYSPWNNPVQQEEIEYSALNYYPNPVRISDGRGAMIINYAGLEQVEDYQIGIYNIKGQKVWESELKRGYSGIRWDCCNTGGDKVAAGVYFLRLSKDGEFLEQGKLTVIK
ncbi:MAG: choice-of-anchor Q domain-containing protein [Candidatus Stygibacter australis]|nr:choice-of-anchor Q domain-containing protein [Candidatus Stygibacter australis]